MAITQSDYSAQMLAQLRLLDPSVSAEVGTPERKIFDTIASVLASAQIDLTQLSGTLDIDSKVGSNLDNFLALFGFGRQQPVKASGFVEFSVTSALTQDIIIASGTQVMAPQTSVSIGGSIDEIQNVIFETTFQVTLTAGQLSVLAPVRAITAGSLSNVAANTVNSWAGNVVFGIQEINNPAAISGGIDTEDDDELKIRFKNTVFRNLAGTQDQYIALATSASSTTKVNVVGPISRYREYIQVPQVDDATAINVDPETTGPGSADEPGNGNAGEYTTALSTIPYSQHTYTEVPTFVSNGNTGINSIFWRQDVDWTLNTTSDEKNRGDAYRFYNNDAPLRIGPDPLGTDATYQPSVTFDNVYTGADNSVTAVRPGDTLLLEHSYLSTSSRNDVPHNITNCVDVFVDGINDTNALTIIPSPGISTTHAFVSTPINSKYYVGNYRRDGQPITQPTAGNIFMPLFWQPTTDLPDSITVFDDDNTATYYKNEHYWLAIDTTELYGTIRARNGIEFNANLAGADGTSNSNRSGLKLNEFPTDTSMEVDNYTFDKNIVDTQSAIEAAKQTTTDVLVHRSRIRYFKLDVTVMYTAGANPQTTNDQMNTAIANFFQSGFFGNTIQLSDLLQAIHDVGGIDNVRWSSDIPSNTDLNRIAETDRDGNSLPGIEYNADFTLKDDELPLLPDAVSEDDQNSRFFATEPGLIIRSRAQNTWTSAV